MGGLPSYFDTSEKTPPGPGGPGGAGTYTRDTLRYQCAGRMPCNPGDRRNYASRIKLNLLLFKYLPAMSLELDFSL